MSSRRHGRLVDGPWYLCLWSVSVLAFYSLPASKRGVYLLPLYPAVALLMGWWWARRAYDSDRPTWGTRLLLRLFAWAATAAAILLMLTLAIDHASSLLDWVAALVSEREQANVQAAIEALREHLWLVVFLLGLAAAGGLAIEIGIRRHWWVAFAGMLLIAAAGTTVVRQAVLPGIAEAQTARGFIAQALALAGPSDVPFVYGSFDYGAVYYARRHLPRYDGPWAGGPRLLIMSKKLWGQVRPRAALYYAPATLREAGGARPIESAKLILVERSRE